MARAVDVVVVGAGVIGLALSWRAAEAGRSVVLCDPHPGEGASWAAAGMLAPVTEASVVEAPLTRLGLESARRWPAFAAALSEAAGGAEVGLREEGTLAVAFDSDDRRQLEQLLRVHHSLGLTSEWLPAADCRRLEPRLSPRIRGALRVAGDWQVDNRAVVRALLTAVSAAGVTQRRVSVRRLIGNGSRVDGVELADGTHLAAATVVLAAGAHSGTIEGLPAPARPPVRPVKGEILRLAGDPADPVLEHTVRASVEGRSVYVVPRRHGEVVVGASSQEAGFDTRVRAGAVEELLRAAVDLVPGLAELELVECRAGLRPGTPDNGPVLGRTPVAGLVLATGHYRNGMLLTPVTVDAIDEVLAGHDLPEVAAPFTLERFW
ncbi:MAG: glycine oxidase ThiO [Acidimicrobiaceae bacterium]|nr:glycine oxidase ThiO [Acidimicrobiaceae bacterium]